MLSDMEDSRSQEDRRGGQWTWEGVSASLYPLAKRLVFSAAVPSWRGQEDDTADDLVQETIRRMFEYTLRAEERGERPLTAPERLARVVLQNCFRDLRRRDLWLMHLPDGLSFPEAWPEQVIDPLEAAVENIFEESLFQAVAAAIARFPEGQRTALLIDLADRIYFDVESTALQQAFLNEGIQLEEYRQRSLPATPAERAKHSSLLAQAYKRLTQLSYVQHYIVATGDAPPAASVAHAKNPSTLLYVPVIDEENSREQVSGSPHSAFMQRLDAYEENMRRFLLAYETVDGQKPKPIKRRYMEERIAQYEEMKAELELYDMLLMVRRREIKSRLSALEQEEIKAELEIQIWLLRARRREIKGRTGVLEEQALKLIGLYGQVVLE